MKTINPVLLVAPVLVALAAAFPSPAAAVTSEHYRNTSAGGACHPANGGAAAKFTRANHYLTNNNSTDQYVVCHFEMDDPTQAIRAPEHLSIHVWSPTAGTVQCVAQTGSYRGGTVHLNDSVSRSYTFAERGSHALTWLDTPQRGYVHDVLTLNCRVGPGMRLGLIERKDNYEY